MTVAAPAMTDLGDVYPLAFTTRNADGDPEDAGAVTLTITLPDGTTSTPSVDHDTGSGVYTVDYNTVQAGRHVYRWVATGANAAAYGDVFNVVPADVPAIVGLAEAKHHLGIPATDTTKDDKLRSLIGSASAVVEWIVGAVVRRTVVETHHGGRAAIVLRKTPVLSVTSVTEDGATLASSGYVVSDAGVLYRASNFQLTDLWRPGVKNVAITYVVGRTIVTASVLEGTLELIRINWRPQQGGNYSDYDQGLDDDYGTREPGEFRLGIFLPYAVQQRLAPEDVPDGFA